VEVKETTGVGIGLVGNQRTYPINYGKKASVDDPSVSGCFRGSNISTMKTIQTPCNKSMQIYIGKPYCGYDINYMNLAVKTEDNVKTYN
jgi:hypothetical protein